MGNQRLPVKASMSRRHGLGKGCTSGEIGMHMAKVRVAIRVCLVLALFAAAMGWRSANAQDFLNQDWLLNSAHSHVYMQTEKLQGVIEKHQFTSVEGTSAKMATQPSRSI